MDQFTGQNTPAGPWPANNAPVPVGEPGYRGPYGNTGDFNEGLPLNEGVPVNFPLNAPGAPRDAQTYIDANGDQWIYGTTANAWTIDPRHVKDHFRANVTEFFKVLEKHRSRMPAHLCDTGCLTDVIDEATALLALDPLASETSKTTDERNAEAIAAAERVKVADEAAAALTADRLLATKAPLQFPLPNKPDTGVYSGPSPQGLRPSADAKLGDQSPPPVVPAAFVPTYDATVPFGTESPSSVPVGAPANPFTGQRFVDTAGVTWSWYGTAWNKA